MNRTEIRTIDAGIGLENVQMVELEEWLAVRRRPKTDIQMLCIDELAELAELGCYYFYTILYIGNERFVSQSLDKVRTFICAVKRATDCILA
jgi:pyrimidine precursor biosynthesis enzyme